MRQLVIKVLNIIDARCNHEVYVLIFSRILAEIFLILRRIHRDIVANIGRSLCKVPVVPVLC